MLMMIISIYDANRTTAEDILVYHNNMNSSLKYNLEFERDIFAATLNIWRPSPLSTTGGRAMPW
jgi:hypothetical protein